MVGERVIFVFVIGDIAASGVGDEPPRTGSLIDIDHRNDGFTWASEWLVNKIHLC
jgi:hypothetical protein